MRAALVLLALLLTGCGAMRDAAAIATFAVECGGPQSSRKLGCN